MTRLGFISLFVLLSLQLQANSFENMFIAEASMTVNSARGIFKELQTVSITLLATEGQVPTNMMLKFGEGEVVGLHINDSSNESGSISYGATLPEHNPMGTRFSVNLTETTCADTGLKTWKASVRSGFGWCGTMDSTMELSGSPVYFNR